VNGEVLRYFRDRFHLLRLPRRLRDGQAALHRAVAELSQQLGRSPRPTELAAHLGMDLDTVIEGLGAFYTGRVSSLDEPAQDDPVDGRIRFGAALATTEPEFDLIEYRASLGPLLAELPARERRILLLRFFHGMTQREIAQDVGLSQVHVFRLLAVTLADLRRHLVGDRSTARP
jgi:RNA polymerase sigma-B factor